MRFLIQIALLGVISFLFLQPLKAQEGQTHEWKTKTSDGYTYKYVTNDPSNARFYTLDNGLTVILSPSKKKPRIQAYIATKAGSKTDPKDHTGLAHYLEHLLFKGTDQYGSLDWEKEKPLLDEVEDLYEAYNSTTDKVKRKAIYKKIDEVSGEAAKYAIANEYDKMMSAMGSQGTNAFTSFEQTVYTEDIPSNAMERYLKVQAERFRKPVFRLFHTELEAVYEEKNISLDTDGRKVFEEMFKQIFPHNNYGKQTTIGTIEHLKNPSLKEIQKYFDTYYVPNNMGVIMAGDFDPDELIGQIDRAFSYMKSKAIPEYKFPPEEEIKKPILSEVYGPESEYVMMGYRFPGADSEDAQMLGLVGSILTNGSAGLIDLDLVKKQKLLGAGASPTIMKDYSVMMLYGSPVGGQSLDEVKSLLVSEIEKLKKGDFADDLITSIINNEKKGELQQNESYGSRAGQLMNGFVLETDWLKRVKYIENLSKITKEDIVDFANKYFKDNYVAVYKRKGEDKDIVKVEKPTITPVEVNRNDQSAFLQEVNNMTEEPIKPVWLDYKKDIDRAKAGKYNVLAVRNKDNDLFTLNYHYSTGSWGDRLLSLAAGYLDYIGTENKSSEDISKDFYKLASRFNVSVSAENTQVTLSGLQENFEETVRMFDDILKNLEADEEALKSYIKRLKKSRTNAKSNKGQIMSALQSYVLYGEKNPFNNNFTDDELDQVTGEELIEALQKLRSYDHKLLYYGPLPSKKIAKTLKEIHPAPKSFKPLPASIDFKQTVQKENKVYLAYYDMVQAEVYWVRNSDFYDPDKSADVRFFNQYFGGGMQSIVFQTIRESKALAYSTFASFNTPYKKENRDTFLAYVGTQADKFDESVKAMNALLTDLPRSDKAIETAKKSLVKGYSTQRITGMGIINSYLSAERRGLDYDIRKDIYNKMPSMGFSDLQNFFTTEIKGKPYAYCIVAGEDKLDQEKLKELGEVEVLDLEKLFGY